MRAWASFTFFGVFAGQLWRNWFGYWGFGVVACIIFVLAVGVLVAQRPQLSWRITPKSVLAFLGFATLSIAWSSYPGGSTLGVVTQWMTAIVGAALATCLSWSEFVRTFGIALRWLLALSLLFELWVALFVGHPLLPNFLEVSGTVPKAFYWSRNLLLQGGPIEGIVANRNLLGFIALLALIVFVIQLMARTVRQWWGVFWIVVAVATLILTRSATVIVAGIAVAIVALLAGWFRTREADRRALPYAITWFIVAVLGLLIWIARGPVLSVLGKSEDLTGRIDIWATVGDMVAQRPTLGWGWIGYWQPWVPPFDHLIVIKGVTYLQAHNAWLDVAMQLGLVGLVFFAAVVLSTLWRSWFLAIDRPWRGLGTQATYTASSLLPLLLMTALIVQSMAESRLLVEGNFALLIALAFVTKRQRWTDEVTP